jgi:hypothetical protein
VRLKSQSTSTKILALVDSGSERCFAAPGLAREIGVSLNHAVEVTVGLGASPRRVHFCDVEVELFGDLFGEVQPIGSWVAPVGFLTDWTPTWPVLLGQKGFFDQFTVTMHRSVPALVVEPWETFDERFGVRLETVEVVHPRFNP